jgi:hypothetical protein
LIGPIGTLGWGRSGTLCAVTHRGPLTCLFVALLALASACGKPVAGEPQAASGAAVRTSAPKTTTTSRRPTTAPPRTSRAPSTADVLTGLAGTWEGEYTCGQGNTGLKLTIKPLGANTVAPATFEFFPLSSNPSAKKGSYAMIAAVSPSGQLVFKQQQWIDQPAGYVMVDLAVTSPLDPDATQLSGDVLMDNCKGFSVRRR